MPPSPPALIIMTRYPRPGRVKTRLIPALGPQGAARLHGRLTARVAAQARALAARRPLRLLVSHAGGNREEMEAWLGAGLEYWPQPTGDLGQRMHQALALALEQEAPAAMLVGSDLPDLDAALLARAFDLLREALLVLGPAQDGGYYLVGLTRPAPGLFEPLPWGGPRVWEATLARARELGLAPALLPVLRDLDSPEDLAHHQARWSDLKEGT